MHDPAIRDAVLSQTTVVDRMPEAPSSRCFRALATRVSGLSSNSGPGLRLMAPTAASNELVEVRRWA